MVARMVPIMPLFLMLRSFMCPCTFSVHNKSRYIMPVFIGKVKGGVKRERKKMNFSAFSQGYSGEEGAFSLGMVMVSTIWLSVSRRSDTAGMPLR